GMLFTSPAGNDLPFDEGLCEQGRNFCNKIWNALRLVNGWTEDPSLSQPGYAAAAVQWFEARLSQAMASIEDLYGKYRLSEALMTVYKLIWDDFCSWYLEMVKPAYQQPTDSVTLSATTRFFGELMKILHPFMPFISEEIWHRLAERNAGEDLIITPMPEAGPFDEQLLAGFSLASEVIMAIRTYRQDKGIPQKDALAMYVTGELPEMFVPVIRKMGNLSLLETVAQKPAGTLAVMVGTLECAFPLGDGVDAAEEIDRLEKELEYNLGFLKSVEGKLKNEKFMASAPQKVIDTELKKQADTLEKIKALRAQIDLLR
ncbi:MAG TPA: class I tRNA ligase family protein, partial [Bacteroidales bacterium]|nr:class I tRNA ligase family protein [Bacteroidales bacterium]